MLNSMITMSVLLGIAVLGAAVVTVLDVLDDGRRHRQRPPRSHLEEVGSWVEQHLRR